MHQVFDAPARGLNSSLMFFRLFLLMSCATGLSPLALCASGSSPAPELVASPDTVAVWPEGKIPGRVATAPEAALPPRGDGVLRVANVSRPTLTVFPVPGAGVPAPAAVVCPGGGYSYLAYEKEGTEIAAWLNAHGFAALVLKYRVPDNRDGALQDVQRALRVARANAAEWGIDPRRLGVMGFSAGGNLAAKASTRFARSTYSEIDDVDKRSSRPDFAVLVYPAYLDKDGAIAADLDLSADIPPTLIVHSEDDARYVSGSKLYAAALQERNTPHRFLLYPTGGHGYGLRSKGAATAWPGDALDWLRATVVRPVP